jgi:hypothetical protein
MNGKNSQPDCECGIVDFFYKAKRELTFRMSEP